MTGDKSVTKSYTAILNIRMIIFPFFSFRYNAKSLADLLQSRDIQNFFRGLARVTLTVESLLFLFKSNISSAIAISSPPPPVEMKTKFWVGTARRRFSSQYQTIKCTSCREKTARFENAKIFVVFKIRFSYKNRARAFVPFFVTLFFLLFLPLFVFLSLFFFF